MFLLRDEQLSHHVGTKCEVYFEQSSAKRFHTSIPKIIKQTSEPGPNEEEYQYKKPGEVTPESLTDFMVYVFERAGTFEAENGCQ